MKAFLKSAMLGTGRSGRCIPLGLYSGLTLSLDPSCEMGLWLGTYEAETTPWLRRAGSTARSLVDVGAGYGELTVWGLKQPRMERVLAYDPKPERWSVFRENLALNGLTGDSRLATFEEWFLGADDSGAAEQLFATLPEPILVKIDVDGGEEMILQRMGGVLAAKRMLLLVETHSRALDAACHDLLVAAGYDVRRLTPAWWRRLLREQRPIGFNQWLVAEVQR
ncbi:MAG: hypothetical protein IAE97_06145 [Chthoniobacterales bacterium]|nr:hypothetical protein [Chthoniobacterales bacterium]